jgi:structural maintenance of chromosomes protein 6
MCLHFDAYFVISQLLTVFSQKDIREVNSNVGVVNRQIKEYEETIEAENEKLAAREGGKLEAIQNELKAAQTALGEAENQAKALLQRVSDQRDEVSRIEREGTEADRVAEDLKRALGETEAALQRAHHAKSNELAVYGQGMPEALRRISQVRWQGEAPIGPFGRYVKLRLPKWGPVLRGQLGGLMFAFTITDSRDRAQLKQILDSTKWLVIYLSFDFATNDPEG